jgi:hypothetical protein
MNIRLTMLAATSLLWARRAHGEPDAAVATATESCLPTAVLHGEQELVAALGYELNLLGVSSRATEACPTATAAVERGSNGVVVSLREPDGRRARRSLSDVRIAATWIDSWLHEDLGAPLLAIRLLPQTAPVRPILTASPVVTSNRSVPAPAMNEPPKRFFAMVAYESIDIGQDASWRGVRAGLCTQLGLVCVGARVSAANNSDETFPEAEPSTFSRTSVDVLAHADFPFHVGQATIRPGIALGAGWFQTHREGVSECNFPPTEDGSCADMLFEDEPSTQRTLAPKAEVELSLTLPIAQAVSLSLGGSLGVRPFGADERRVETSFPSDEPEPCPAPTDPSDPNCGDVSFLSIVAIPREPFQFWKLFLGVQVQL